MGLRDVWGGIREGMGLGDVWGGIRCKELGEVWD